MDFKLTKDGDLLLGQQLIDEEGYLLYYHHEGPDGLPVIKKEAQGATASVHDVQMVTDDEERLQLIQTRLRTENPDWYLYENVGASLSDFIGETNSPETARRIEQRVMETLQRNEAFSEEELEINAIPISMSELLVDVILDSENQYLRYAFSIDFDVGINNTYVLDEDGNILDEPEEENPDIYENIPDEEVM